MYVPSKRKARHDKNDSGGTEAKMSTLEEKKALRDQGLTYQEIADRLGISRQAVNMSLAGYNPRLFRHVTETGCIYPNLRRWMNDNKVSPRELTRRIGYEPFQGNIVRTENRLRGSLEMKKSFIDGVLRVTGMKYEEAFWKEDAAQ